VVAVITVAAIIIFDYTNGFHDASTSWPMVASRAMTLVRP
jgi:phosphate/sulfate permease